MDGPLGPLDEKCVTKHSSKASNCSLMIRGKKDALSALLGVVACCRKVADCLVKCTSFHLKSSTRFSKGDSFKDEFERFLKQTTDFGHSSIITTV